MSNEARYIIYYSGGSEKLQGVSLGLAKETAKKLKERGKIISSVEISMPERLSLEDFLKL